MESSEFEMAMQELRKEYLLGLPERLNEVEGVWQGLLRSGWSETDFRTFIRMAHNLAGSGATYGVVPLSQAAREVELYSKGLNAAAPPPAEMRAQVETRLAALRAVIDDALERNMSMR